MDIKIYIFLRAIPLALPLAGWDPSSSSSALQQFMQTIQSWVAAAHTIADESNKGNVPTVYTKQTLGAASRALQQQEMRANTLSVPPEQRKQVTKPIPSLLQTIDQLAGAMRRGDHPAVAASSAIGNSGASA